MHGRSSVAANGSRSWPRERGKAVDAGPRRKHFLRPVRGLDFPAFTRLIFRSRAGKNPMPDEEVSYVIVTPYSMGKSPTGGIIAGVILAAGVGLVTLRMFGASGGL